MKRCAGGGIILSSVVTRYQLGFVSRPVVDRAAECRYSPRHLRICHKRSLFWVDVGREGGVELRTVEEQVSVLRRQDRRGKRDGGRGPDERSNRLPPGRGTRRAVEGARNPRGPGRPAE